VVLFVQDGGFLGRLINSLFGGLPVLTAIVILLFLIFFALVFIGSEPRWLCKGLALVMEHIGMPKAH
jgi:hypothetical protein